MTEDLLHCLLIECLVEILPLLVKKTHTNHDAVRIDSFHSQIACLSMKFSAQKKKRNLRYRSFIRTCFVSMKICKEEIIILLLLCNTEGIDLLLLTYTTF